ncbi:MAG: alpha/beta fold hydrolase, partial [Candidatus Aminicenantales bacterium]
RNTVAARLFLTRLFYETKKLPPDLLEFSLKVLEEKRAREICLEVLREGVSVKGVKQEIWHSVADKSASLPHKTLIIWGADDKITPLSQAYRGRRLIRNSKLIVFDRCGHLPQIEWPEKFNQSVLHFLKS